MGGRKSRKRAMSSTDNREESTKKRTHSPAITNFNSLPVEIQMKIFCNIDCNKLYFLKNVCTKWWKIIREILNFERLEISKERIDNAVNIVENMESYSFNVYQAPYDLQNLVCKNTIGTLLQEWVGLYTLGYTDYIEKLYYTAKSDTGSEDKAERCVWKCLLGITGLSEEYLVEELKGKNIYYKFPAMDGYERYDNADNLGITVLYPDKRTFAVLVHPDLYVSESDYSHDPDLDEIDINDVDALYGDWEPPSWGDIFG